MAELQFITFYEAFHDGDVGALRQALAEPGGFGEVAPGYQHQLMDAALGVCAPKRTVFLAYVAEAAPYLIGGQQWAWAAAWFSSQLDERGVGAKASRTILASYPRGEFLVGVEGSAHSDDEEPFIVARWRFDLFSLYTRTISCMDDVARLGQLAPIAWAVPFSAVAEDMFFGGLFEDRPSTPFEALARRGLAGVLSEAEVVDGMLDLGVEKCRGCGEWHNSHNLVRGGGPDDPTGFCDPCAAKEVRRRARKWKMKRP